ncbi:unnamed protein product [Prunus armeniaca]
MEGGVICLVLSEIQWLKLCNTPTTPFKNELPTNLNSPISWTNRYGVSPKLGEQHNMVGGVVWLVLSEIQCLKPCNTPTTPFQNELPTNLNSPISWTNRYHIESKIWGTTEYGGRSHLVGLEGNPIAKTMQYTNHSISERTSYEPEWSDFMDQSISDCVQNLGNNIIWWEE